MANRVQRRATAATVKKQPIGPGEIVPSNVPVVLTDAPHTYATGLQLAEFGNDLVLTFTQPQTGHVVLQGENVSVATAKAATVVVMSVPNVKEILVVLGDAIDRYEAQNGKIETPFLRARKPNN